MSTDGLSAPGTASYSSGTMSVGDGTWDSDRNDFLLPNLQGLNFATMQYNGMGNRFRDLPQYHVLILGHGILAAIVFVVMVPAAIFIAKFWHSESRMAFKLHIYIQILVVFLSTVILILGWFAVGPERSLTNPHHGIGVAIYVCILVQFLYGWLMFKRERKRKAAPRGLPLGIYIHRLFGRSIAVLGFVQIALGLTLYGSPKALFILYAFAGFLLLFAYIALRFRFTYRAYTSSRPGRPPPSEYYSDYGDGSYISGPQTMQTANSGRKRDDKSHWARNAVAAAGLFGAYEWWKKRGDKRQSEKEDRYDERMDSRVSRPSSRPGSRPASRPSSRPPRPSGQYGPESQYASSYGPPASQGPPPPPGGYVASRPPSRGSRISRRRSHEQGSEDTWERDDEKYAADRKHTWRDRLLGAGAGIAAFEGVKSLFGSRKSRRNNDDYLESSSVQHPSQGHRYGPASEVNQNTVSQADVSRVESGQAPFSPNDQRRYQAVRPDTLTPVSPSRPPPRRRPSADALSYADAESHAPRRRPGAADDQTWRELIGALGIVAGSREWNKRRKQRRVDEQAEILRRQEIEDEENFNRRNSNHYPLPEHSTVAGRRPSMSGTLMTGPDPVIGSNPQESRQDSRPDTMHPPLPATAGSVPAVSAVPSSAAHPFTGSHNIVEQQQYHQAYNLPPPPPGPPPLTARPAEYYAPEPGSLQMPLGAVNPDPSRLVSRHNVAESSSHAAEGALVAGAAGALLESSGHQRTQSQSPSRYRDSRTHLNRYGRPGSLGSGTVSQAGPSGPASTAGSVQQPPVRVKVQVHDDGNHVTLRRLNDQEAAAERNARQRPSRARRNSSLSSAGEDRGSRYRRGQNIRPSAGQPYANVPLPPAMSGNVDRPSESSLPLAGPSRLPQASASPQAQAGAQQISPPPHSLAPASGPAGSGAFASPPNIMSDAGTGTDVSAFDTNRRRRRAERARRDAAAKGPRVEFE